MKFIKVSKVITLLMLTIGVANGGTLAEFYGTKGQADAQLTNLISKLDTIDYATVGKNEHIEKHYYNKYKERNLDLLDFFTVIDIKSVRDLLIKNPDFGAYAPFNLLAYKKLPTAKGGDTTWYGHLNIDTMINIIGEKDKATNDKFRAMVGKIDTLIQKEMKPTESNKMEYSDKLPDEPLLKMVKKFSGVTDIEEYVEEFVMAHDGAFSKNHFLIAGFIDIKFELSDMDMDMKEYDAYWVSSLCHFQFSNAVFNRNAPHAGVFAPCSVYFYIPKGSNELHVGYATVENWIATTGIKDKSQIRYMQQIADDVLKTFVELGFVLEEGTGGESANAIANPRELAKENKELKSIVSKIQKDVEELKKAQ